MTAPEGPCANCGSRDIVPDALVLDRGHGNIDSQELRAVARRPDALLFKRTAKQERRWRCARLWRRRAPSRG